MALNSFDRYRFATIDLDPEPEAWIPWAPLLDIFGTKRRWLVTLQTIVGVVILGVAWAAYRVPMESPHGFVGYGETVTRMNVAGIDVLPGPPLF